MSRAQRAGFAATGAIGLAGAAVLQVAIGILTLLQQAPIALALLHQGMAIVVLTIAVIHAERLGRHAAAATLPAAGAAN